jgi:hypothetical protein
MSLMVWYRAGRDGANGRDIVAAPSSGFLAGTFSAAFFAIIANLQ